MNTIELMQNIGNEICDGCGPDRDCGLDVDECSRILSAIALFEKWVKDHLVVLVKKADK